MKKLLNILSWPFRNAAEFIDTRPSAAHIRQDLAQHEPAVDQKDASVIVSLRLVGTEQVLPLEESLVFQGKTMDDAEAFGEGAVAMHGLLVKRVMNLRRSSVKSDAKQIKLVAAEAAREPSEIDQSSELNTPLSQPSQPRVSIELSTPSLEPSPC
jgi:hypothetical protein